MQRFHASIACLVLVGFMSVGCDVAGVDEPEKGSSPQMKTPQSPSVIANNVFFYYSDLKGAWAFYGDILGFETVADYGFAKIMQVAETSFITLVDAQAGMDFAEAPKTVAVALVTDELDGWYSYLTSLNVSMRSPEFAPQPGSPHDGFVAIDPEGYLLEFERFNEHPENAELMPLLAGLEPVSSPESLGARRPSELGVKAAVYWLYSQDVRAMSRFYAEEMGFPMIVDQGWAMVHQSSRTGFIGPVDGAKGMHSWTESKAVMLSLLTRDIEGWFNHLSDQPGFVMRDEEIGLEERAGARVFVGQDPDGYFIELDEFFEFPDNDVLLERLASD